MPDEGDHNGVDNGGFTKNNVTYTWDSSFFYTVMLDGATYSNGNTIYSEGDHTIEVTDFVDHTTTYSFTIDKTAPTLSLSGVANTGFTSGTVKATWGTDTGSMTSQLTNS